MADIESYARQMLLKARQDADQLLAAAQDEAERIKQSARADGLALGKKEGVAQGKAEGAALGKKEAFEAEKKRVGDLSSALQAALTALDEQRRDLIEKAESEVLPLALSIARKVTKRMGQLDPRVVEANAREAARLVLSRHEIRIAVHPSQKQTMDDVAVRLKQQWPQFTTIQITESESITPGGCRITTAGGEIDAELETQLDRIAMELVPTPV